MSLLFIDELHKSTTFKDYTYFTKARDFEWVYSQETRINNGISSYIRV